MLMLCLYTAVSAQDAHPSLKHYTVEDGLPSSEVYQVKQDSKGYIWFATGNGVSRFNGYEFENFSLKDGLPDNTVFEIYEDKFERIWFVPLSCKLSYYYKGKIYLFPYNEQLQKVLMNSVKTSFCVDGNGTVFLGLQSHGIIEIAKNGKMIRHFSPTKAGTINIMQPDAHTYLYSYSHGSSEKGSYKDYPHYYIGHINFCLPSRKTEISFPMKEFPIALGSSARMIETKGNKVLLGIDKGLIRFEKNDLSKFTVDRFPYRIIWLYEDKDEDLWVGTLPGGVYYLKKGKISGMKHFLEGQIVTGVLQDNEGGFWFTTEGHGVYYTPSKKVMVFDKTIAFSDDRIICLATDGKHVFSGTQNGFIEKIHNDERVKTFNTTNHSLYTNEISSLFYDTVKKQLWISAKAYGGVIEKDRYKPDKSVLLFNDMVQDSGNVFWMACAGGLALKQDDLFRTVVSVITAKRFRRLNGIVQSWDRRGLMLGAINGLWTYTKRDSSYEYIGYKHKLLENRILDLGYFSESLLVIATKGAGVLLYNLRDERVVQINMQKGLLGDNVYSIHIDSSVIWVATNKGLNKLIVEQEQPLKYRLKSYTQLHGLPSNEINNVLKVGNRIWLATNKGLAFFHPDSIDSKEIQLPVYIDRILINDKDTAVSSMYTLAHNQNNIKINYTGLGYKIPGKLKYRYKMMGLDTNWNYTNAREIQYTTLPANNYSFVLNVQNPDGSWSKHQAIFRFKILLPFWKEWWFILGITVLGVYLIFIFIRYRLKRVQLRNEKISNLNKTLVSLKLKALRAQMNPHFTFNVMNSIQHFIASNNGEAANRYLSRFSKLIRLILNNSERTVVPLADEIKALELYLELEVMRFDERFEYKITVDKSIDIMDVEIPSMLIQPYVENSIKHGILNLNRKGIIKIDIERQNNFIKCTIEDNGVGRTESYFRNKGNLHKSFGTTITQERLAAINELNNSELSEQVIDLLDEHGNATGTKVEIFIPFT